MISQIKEKINCVEYARRVGLPIARSGDRMTSLEGGTNRTACVVNDDFFYDFKMNQGGDVIDLCAIYRHNGNRSAAVHELAEMTGVQGVQNEDWIAYTQNLCNQIQAWHVALRPEDREYLHKRKINDETIKRLKIGYNGRLVIPYFKNRYVAYYISRSMDGSDPKYKKAKKDGLNENIPWGLHTIKEENDILVIAEGAFDAISFEQEGFSVLSTMGGHFNKDQLKTVFGSARQFKKVYVCFDNDEAGSGFTLNFSKQLFSHKIQFMCMELPARYKDVSEYYEAGGNLQDLIVDAKNGLVGLCERIKSKDEFKQFAYTAARFVGKPELAELFKAAEHNFDKTWFAEVRKQAMSAPPEYMIVNDIKSKHKLIFIEALGFYEYERGCWNKKEDSAINAYISGELGNYMTGNKISSIAKLMKAERANNNIVFNRKPLFNFKNGTLDLETLEFREHNEADYCSIQADYNYDPSKECPRWEKFIAEICDNDGKRKALMQEISGYVLFDDNSLQKCFMLIGEGANGKSVFLDILTEVFGRKNVSNVEMSGLAESFQRILLMDSILNISTETQTDVKGAESVFKQIVVGDPINGCYKNKDFISFRPRSKIILACNEFIKSKDMTHGFIRRICFVNFPNKFVDEPDPFNDNEKKADKDIISKLMEELPGIFNWALKGYRFLKEVKEFIKTDDEDELVRDFTESINPVLIFMREYPFVEGYDYIWADVYDDYQEWCKKSGHMYRSRHYFIRTFKPLFLKEHRNYEEFQSGSKRGVRQKCANSVQNSVQTEAAIEEHEQKMMNLHT